MPNNDLHFEKAPIVEAIIAIDVAPSLDDTVMAQLEAASTEFQADYPVSEPLKHFRVQFGVGADAQQPMTQDILHGRKYVSADKTQVVAFNRTGFSFSRLPPYQRWQSFRDEAKRLWAIFRSTTGETLITRFGLRYINRVHIPHGKSMADFLTLYPEVPPNADGSLRSIGSSYMRVDGVVDEIPDGRLIIQQAMLPPEREGFATLSLDFDISVAALSGMKEDFVWEMLEKARDVKNQLFVASMKPDFLETFR